MIKHPARWMLAFGLAVFSSGAALQSSLAQQTPGIFGGFELNSQEPIQVEADALEVNDTEETRVSVFTGNVVVTRGNTLIKAQRLSIFSPVEAGGAAEALNQENFQRLVATGQVSVSSGNQTATGTDLVLDMEARSIEITGDVILTDGNNVLTGNRLVINLDTGQANIQNTTGGRVRALFNPEAAAQR